MAVLFERVLRMLHLTMFFIVKARIWEDTVLLTMKNIVKVADPPQLRALFIPSACAR
ncbi:hypothetical protein J2Z66_005397 [Paenibacillus eucommiae]|uniref:Uncharacterized protein n=1 Tax=Paenibacillus eucommiae TaxID=1355755 RepID=A0ABS4J1R8_9BACL|nr:hypothetical protein [Paenibacillus eucommiae]